jgi:hypothetical protein
MCKRAVRGKVCCVSWLIVRLILGFFFTKRIQSKAQTFSFCLRNKGPVRVLRKQLICGHLGNLFLVGIALNSMGQYAR